MEFEEAWGQLCATLIIACPDDYSMYSVGLSREERDLQLHDIKGLDVPESSVLCYLLKLRDQTSA